MAEIYQNEGSCKAYKMFSIAWKEDHQNVIGNLNYMEILRHIATDWSLLKPKDKIVYYQQAGIQKTIKGKRKTTSHAKDEEDFTLKGKRRRSRSIASINEYDDYSSEEDSFSKKKRKYRKRKHS